jgi:hypothetical protein
MPAEAQRRLIAENACRHRKEREHDADRDRSKKYRAGMPRRDKGPECHQPGANAVELEAMRTITKKDLTHGRTVVQHRSEIQQPTLRRQRLDSRHGKTGGNH